MTGVGWAGRIEGRMAASDTTHLERSTGRGAGGWGERVWVVAACSLIVWFYGWTTRSEGVTWNFGGRQTDYYNLLVDGFLDGHLYMKVEVPEELLKLDDPYNPANRPPGVALHDASMYRGRYYIYFGTAPVVTLVLPFRVLTGGTALPLPAAVAIFTCAGFFASVGLFTAIRRRYFPDTGTAMMVLGVLALGTVSMGPLLVLRGSIWELPLSSGYFYAMVALLCVWRSVHAEGRAAGWWFAGAGLSLGLAVASRPTYLFAGGMMAVPALWWIWGARGTGRVGWSTVAKRVLAGALPLGAVGLAMAWYNYARFGSPTEFGVKYQFSGIFEAETQHFRWSYFPLNFQMYWLNVVEWIRYFPFLQRGATPAIPAGHLGFDDLYGALTNLPLVWLALGAPLAAWRRRAEERGPLGVTLGATAMVAAGTAVPLLFFYAAMARYGVDFLPELVVLALTGAMAWQRWARLSGAKASGWPVSATVGGLAAASIFFAVMLSLQAYDALRRESPRTYARIAHGLNHPSWWLERLVGTEHGPVELDGNFSPKPAGTRETLVRTGTTSARDEVFLQHDGGGRGRIGFVRAGGPERLSAAGALEGAAGRRLRVELGSLYPPESHPFFAEMSAVERIRLARRLVVTWGGERVFDGYQRFHTASPADVVMAAGGRRVGGIAEIRAAAVRAAEAAGAVGAADVEFEAIRMKVSFPEGRRDGREPLVVTGEAGRGDFLFVEYLDGGRVRFGLDHWGKASVTSAAVAVERGKACAVEVMMGAFPGARRPDELTVKVDGRVVWAREAKLFAVGAEDVFVGKNPIGGTGCAENFSGTILDVVRGTKPDSVR